MDSDMSKWPAILWPDIYTYLIEKTSVFTKDTLHAYKSMYVNQCPAQLETGVKYNSL